MVEVTINQNAVTIMFGENKKTIVLDKYEGLKEIGQGANGVVLSGVNKWLQREEAIKIYIPNHAQCVSEEQFRREVMKTASLKDSRYVTVYDALMYEEGIYICFMELIEGITLREWNVNEHDNINRILVCGRILEAILNYHNKGILHGDIHDKNILIDKGSNIHIIDFGTSLFGGEGFSQERESYFIYDVVKKTLKDLFKKDNFRFQQRLKIQYRGSLAIDDVRAIHPMLIAKTLGAFVDYLDRKEQICMSNPQREEIYGLCMAVAKGPLFLYTPFIKEITLISQKYGFTEDSIATFISGDWEEMMYPSGMSSADEEECFHQSLEIYYEAAKESFSTRDWKKSEQFYFSNRNGFDTNYTDIADLFSKSKEGTFYEFLEKVPKEKKLPDSYMFECDCREILADILRQDYGDMGLAYISWLGFNRIWIDKCFA